MSDERLTIPPIVPGTSDRLLHASAGVWVGLAAGLGGAALVIGLALARTLVPGVAAFVLLSLGAVVAAAWIGGAMARHLRPADGAVAALGRAPDVARPAGGAVFDQLGLTLSGQLDMASLAKAVTDAGVAMTGAAFGAFLYRDGSGAPTHYVIGAPPDAFVDFPLAPETGELGSPFKGPVARSDDLEVDGRFGANLPFKQLPAGHVPARSYLLAPVHSSTGGFRGGLFFGHPDPRMFREADEHLIANLAAHAAIAADNAHLYREAQEAGAAAEAANRVKDAFLATLSHELRTPLTAIVGWANLLKLGRFDADETTRALDTILRNATAQNQIIDDLLDVSRIITGKIQLDLRVVEVGVLVKGAVETVTPAANAKGIRLQLLQDPAGSCVVGDPDRLQQVFWNLLFNAVKFTPKNGRIRVSVQSIGSSVEIAFNDTGLGIAPEFLPHIFERFTQSDSTSTRTARGLGLGLSIARQLAELHGGTIRAESDGLGLGSTFTASFPRSPVTVTVAATKGRVYSRADETVGLERAPRLDGLQVLVVEDDEDARTMIETVLTGQGASVRAVSNAGAALDALSVERVDVLVSDIEMPGTDGYQMIRALRLRPSKLGGTVPALALSAYARTEDRLRALREGFQLHLAKPVQPVELVTVVASLAARPAPQGPSR
jgi:signal transduction histidine kinase/CheY-like chemotaxis protein